MTMKTETPNSPASEVLYSLRVLQTPGPAGALPGFCWYYCPVYAVLFLPWQQNIHGRGSVTCSFHQAN